jgi:hypothetical protein
MSDATPELPTAPTDHDRMAHRIEGVLSEKIFEEIFDRPGWLSRSEDLDFEDLSGTPYEGLYDPETWPVVVVDPDGRRFEVDVQVFVHPLPPVAEQHERHLADVAKWEAIARTEGVARADVEQTAGE